MSCNGCRVLRKGCGEGCVLRPCLQWIDSPESQGYATVFVAKFFGRAGLISFISNVPESQRPALFQSLLFEACGRTVNPVNGAIGLLGTGRWHICEAAVQTVLRGGARRPVVAVDESFEEATCSNMWSSGSIFQRRGTTAAGMKLSLRQSAELDLCLNPSHGRKSDQKRRRAGTPSEESGTSIELGDNCNYDQQQISSQVQLLNLFR